MVTITVYYDANLVEVVPKHDEVVSSFVIHHNDFKKVQANWDYYKIAVTEIIRSVNTSYDEVKVFIVSVVDCFMVASDVANLVHITTDVVHDAIDSNVEKSVLVCIEIAYLLSKETSDLVHFFIIVVEIIEEIVIETYNFSDLEIILFAVFDINIVV